MKMQTSPRSAATPAQPHPGTVIISLQYAGCVAGTTHQAYHIFSEAVQVEHDSLGLPPAGAVAKKRTAEACMLMELLLLVGSITQSPAVRQEQEPAWPPQRFLKLAQLLQPRLLAAKRPGELLTGADQQRADHLVGILCI